MILPNNEYSFQAKIQGDASKEWFEGSFTVLCILNNEQQMRVALAADRYNAGSKTLPEQFKLFNRIVAELDVRILKSPTWWVESEGGWKLHDANVVHEVFNLALKAPEVWAERLKEKATEAEKIAEKSPIKKTHKKAEESVA